MGVYGQIETVNYIFSAGVCYYFVIGFFKELTLGINGFFSLISYGSFYDFVVDLGLYLVQDLSEFYFTGSYSSSFGRRTGISLVVGFQTEL